MKELLQRLRSSRFVRNALTLGGGTAAGQALFFLVTPILTRTYGPAALAMLGVFLAFLSPATVGLTLRLDVAIVVARSAADAELLLAACFVILPATSLLCAAAFGALVHFDLGGYGAFPAWSAPVMGLMLALAGAFMTLRFWAVRVGAFAPISQGLVWQGVARAAVPVAFAAGSSSWVGLLAGEVAGRVFGIRKLLALAEPALRRRLAQLRWPELRACLVSYRQFPLLHLPSSVFDELGRSISTPLFAAAFGAVDGGQFFLAQRVVLAPALLVGAAVADVYHHRIADAARRQREGGRGEVLRAGRLLVGVGVAVYGPAALVAPWVSTAIFGSSWAETGLVIAALTPAAVSSMVTNPLSRAISLSRVPQAKWVADVARFGLPVAAILGSRQLGVSFLSASAAFAAATVAGDLVYFLVILYTVAPHRLRDLTEGEARP